MYAQRVSDTFSAAQRFGTDLFQQAAGENNKKKITHTKAQSKRKYVMFMRGAIWVSARVTRIKDESSFIRFGRAESVVKRGRVDPRSRIAPRSGRKAPAMKSDRRANL